MDWIVGSEVFGAGHHRCAKRPISFTIQLVVVVVRIFKYPFSLEQPPRFCYKIRNRGWWQAVGIVNAVLAVLLCFLGKSKGHSRTDHLEFVLGPKPTAPLSPLPAFCGAHIEPPAASFRGVSDGFECAFGALESSADPKHPNPSAPGHAIPDNPT